MANQKLGVIITGAGSGIGAATAELFAREGHTVALIGRHREKLDAVASKLKVKTAVLPCDVRRDQEVHWMVDEAHKKLGPIGHLINNAGIFERKSFVETSDDDWQKQFETNLLGPVRT